MTTILITRRTPITLITRITLLEAVTLNQKTNSAVTFTIPTTHMTLLIREARRMSSHFRMYLISMKEEF